MVGSPCRARCHEARGFETCMFILVMAHGQGCSVLLIVCTCACTARGFRSDHLRPVALLCRSSQKLGQPKGQPQNMGCFLLLGVSTQHPVPPAPRRGGTGEGSLGLSGLEKKQVFVLHYCTCNYSLNKPLLPVASPKPTSRLTHAGQQILIFLVNMLNCPLLF